MQELCVLPDLTLPHIVPFCVAKAGVKVLPEVFERCVFTPVELSLDIIEGDGPLDLEVVVRILSPRRQAHELERSDLPAE